MKYKLDNKGVSLAMTIGLLLLLVTLTATINELVIRSLRASHQIEAADRAYLAAEAGIEDALYELSAHRAGYNTPDLGTNDVRKANFSDDLIWESEWQIANTNLSDCNDMPIWELGWIPDYCGRLYENQKIVINLFTESAPPIAVGANEINTAPATINTLDVNSLVLKLRLPIDLVIDNNAFFSAVPPLKIDNDRDGSLNEDGDVGDYPALYAPGICPHSGSVANSDNDCDYLEDEDSPTDEVILWKLMDENGNTFTPARGCIGPVNNPHPSHPGQFNRNVCEVSFDRFGFEVNATFDGLADGSDQDGNPLTLQDFLNNYNTGLTDILQMEIVAVAPFLAHDSVSGERLRIPYFEYGIEYNAGLDVIPDTYFSIMSDGYYQDFKQSITTNVVPRATTRLLDLTIIQQ